MCERVDYRDRDVHCAREFYRELHAIVRYRTNRGEIFH